MTMSATDSAASAMNFPIGQAFSAHLERVSYWYRRRRDLKESRAAFMHTVHLDDRLLDDMGVTREEVLWAASLPLEENAALALRTRAAKRRRSR